MCSRIGDVDRATEAELRLVEQQREGVLRNRRQRGGPAENRPVTHRVDAELAIRDRLEPPIRGVVLDPLPVAAEAVAVVQHRRVLVGERRALIEFAGGEFTEPVEMRFEMCAQVIRRDRSRADRATTASAR